MNASTPVEHLVRENASLRQRNAELQDDIGALVAEADRLRQIVEGLHEHRSEPAPSPVEGGR
jgi:FtsZ-binding cell division protein ZapB